ncbi:MAG TPA: FtsX-like permease family protein [Balneolaceae bacterium]|nr:FtsX-like permease family protein [Balneolaceae bacterium]
MKFTWYIAAKYFRGRNRSSRFLSFIKIMAIGGVAVGSAGLLISLSIAHGFKSTINDKIVGFAPHITIHSFNESFIQRADTLVTYIEALPGVSEVQPVVTGQIMIQASGDVSGALIKGVAAEGDITELHTYIDRGEYQLRETDTGLPGIIIGNTLARHLDAEIGSRITVYALDGLPSPFNTPEIIQFTLTGIYQTGMAGFDDNFALVENTHVRRLFGISPRQATLLEIKSADPDQIHQLHEELQQQAQFPLITESIYQRYANIFAWVNLQEETIPLVIGIMIIVAAFNLIGTVLMMVLERISDIAILKTMGAKSREIKQIFILEGFYVAFAGLLLGIGISLLFYWLQSSFGIIPLSEENYYMSTAPVEPHLLDFIVVSMVTLLLCVIASWLPARTAANTDPVDVLSFGK